VRCPLYPRKRTSGVPNGEIRKRSALAARYRLSMRDATSPNAGHQPVPDAGRIVSGGCSRVETLRMLGRKPRIVPAHALQDGINAARLTIPLARFDAARCARGIDALKSYQAEWDESLRTFKKTPLHDWASHGADAFRYLAMSWREVMPGSLAEPSPLEQLMQEAHEIF
jgi:hypothetical protein